VSECKTEQKTHSASDEHPICSWTELTKISHNSPELLHGSA